jgi:hypothetical protein
MVSRFRRALSRALITAGLLIAGTSSVALAEPVHVGRARGDIIHSRPTHGFDPSGARVAWDPTRSDLTPDADSYVEVSRETTHNVKTTAGIDFLFVQGYSTGPGANGLNYVALSNDTLTETTASTVLSNEITLNGLGRAIGAYAHTNGTATATITKTFTASGTQAAQKAALFSASSAGTMTHVLSFTQRSLVNGDTLAITFTITIT